MKRRDLDDLEKYILRRKRTDKLFAKDFEVGYKKYLEVVEKKLSIRII